MCKTIGWYLHACSRKYCFRKEGLHIFNDLAYFCLIICDAFVGLLFFIIDVDYVDKDSAGKVIGDLEFARYSYFPPFGA